MAIFDLNSFIAKYVVKRPQSMFLKDIENNHETLNSKIGGKKILVIGGCSRALFLSLALLTSFFVAAATEVSTGEDASAAVTRNRAARIFNPCFFMFSSFLPQISSAAAFSYSSRQCFLHL